MSHPRFLFIFAPPYSGSTALATLLNNSPRSMVLNLRAEGQWMVPDLSGNDRWDPDKQIDWGVVRHVWLERFGVIERHEGPLNVVIEKSPPHMVRAAQLLAAFPGATSFAFNRDPYASCASILCRLHHSDMLDSGRRLKALTKIAQGWVDRSYCLCRLIGEMNLLFFSYESFCEQPEQCVSRVLEVCPELESVDCSRKITVKDYPPQVICNQNPRQIALLTKGDIDVISSVLEQHSRLLDSFGYSLWQESV